MQSSQLKGTAKVVSNGGIMVAGAWLDLSSLEHQQSRHQALFTVVWKDSDDVPRMALKWPLAFRARGPRCAERYVVEQR